MWNTARYNIWWCSFVRATISESRQYKLYTYILDILLFTKVLILKDRIIMINVEFGLNYDHMMDRRCRVIEFPIFIIIQKTWIIIILYLPTLAVTDARLLNAHIISCTSRGNFHSTYVPRVSFWCCFLFVKATTGKSMEIYLERFFTWGRKFLSPKGSLNL